MTRAARRAPGANGRARESDGPPVTHERGRGACLAISRALVAACADTPRPRGIGIGPEGGTVTAEDAGELDLGTPPDAGELDLGTPPDAGEPAWRVRRASVGSTGEQSAARAADRDLGGRTLRRVHVGRG